MMKTELKKKFTGILQRTISLRTPFDQIAEILAEAALENLDGLPDQIMNLQALDQPGVERNSQIAYKTGHRDARHAAAELVAMIEAETKNESPAIERDIPVQPKLITATREDFDDTFECPSCAKRFSSYDEFDFCPWCGQRLDWSE